MTIELDFQSKRDVLMAIPNSLLVSPVIPVENYTADAFTLVQWAREDEVELKAVGLDWLLVEDVPVRAGALQHAESIWAATRFTRKDAQRIWKERGPAAVKLRDHLQHAGFYAYRKIPDLYGRVQAIAEGGSNADMLQDLSDLAVLCKQNPEPLQAIKLDFSLLDLAVQTASELNPILGAATGDLDKFDEARLMRDRAFTHLKEAVDEIIACGQYVFWQNPERLRGYSSRYRRTHRVSGAAQQSATPTTVAQ